MRISDWSSDVCSSDLPRVADRGRASERSTGQCRRCANAGRTGCRSRAVHPVANYRPTHRGAARHGLVLPRARDLWPLRPIDSTGTLMMAAANADFAIADAGVRLARSQRVPDLTLGARSEEHTAELQALM